MDTKITPLASQAVFTAAIPEVPSRRNWLKGLSALVGTGLLAAPSALLANPVASAPDALTAATLAGGDEYIGIVKMLAGPSVPQGWMLCDGRTLPVAQHPALFALLGTTYGGDGRTTFALPKLCESSVASPTINLAIKTANAPATTNALAELRLEHHSLRRARRA